MARAMTRVKVASSSTSNRCGCSSCSCSCSSDMLISKPWQQQLGQGAALLVIVQPHRATGPRHAGLAEEQAEAEALALGGEEGPADLLGNRQRHPGTMVADRQPDPLRIPVQLDVEPVRAGIGGIVDLGYQLMGGN